MIERIVALQNDHRRLARIAVLLESRAAQEAPPDSAALALLVDAVYYLTHFPDVRHHPYEDVLAAWLHDLGLLPVEVVALLARQHGELSVLGCDLLRDLESLMRVETETWAGLAPRLRGYAEALCCNMATEESDLLPLAFAEAQSITRDVARIPSELRIPAAEDPLQQATAEDRFCQLRTVIVSEAQCNCDSMPDVVTSTFESRGQAK